MNNNLKILTTKDFDEYFDSEFFKRKPIKIQKEDESILEQACRSKDLKNVLAVKDHLANNFQCPQKFVCKTKELFDFFIKHHQSMPYVVDLDVKIIDKSMFFQLMDMLKTNFSIHKLNIKYFTGKIFKYEIKNSLRQLKDNATLDDIKIDGFSDKKMIERMTRLNKDKKFNLLSNISRCKNALNLIRSTITCEHVDDNKPMNTFQSMIYIHLNLHDVFPCSISDLKEKIEYSVCSDVSGYCNTVQNFFDVLDHLEKRKKINSSINVFDPLTKKLPIILTIVKMMDHNETQRIKNKCSTFEKRPKWDLESDRSIIDEENEKTDYDKVVSTIRRILDNHPELITDIEDLAGTTLHAHLRMRGILKDGEQNERFGINIVKNDEIKNNLESLPQDIMNYIFSFVSKDCVNDYFLNYSIKQINQFFARSVYAYQMEIIKQQIEPFGLKMETFLENNGLLEHEYFTIFKNDRYKFSYLRARLLNDDENRLIPMNKIYRIRNGIQFSKTCQLMEKEKVQCELIVDNLKQENLEMFDFCVDHYCQFDDSDLISQYLESKMKNYLLMKELIQKMKTEKGKELFDYCFKQNDTQCFSKFLEMMDHDPIVFELYEKALGDNQIIKMMGKKLMCGSKRKRCFDSFDEPVNKKMK